MRLSCRHPMPLPSQETSPMSVIQAGRSAGIRPSIAALPNSLIGDVANYGHGRDGLMGGRIVTVPLTAGNTGWTLDPDRLFDACGPKTRMIFLNSPGNPTGWTLDRQTQRRILDFARARGLWIMADEVYSRLVYDG